MDKGEGSPGEDPVTYCLQAAAEHHGSADWSDFGKRSVLSYNGLMLEQACLVGLLVD